MKTLTLQIHDNNDGWLDAGELKFWSPTDIQLEYDVDYAGNFFDRRDAYAFSIQLPVGAEVWRGPVPALIIDLLPQGEPLKRLVARYDIAEDNYQEILARVPLSSPGNIRIKEAWLAADEQRQSFKHIGFTRNDIADHTEDFIQYMVKAGAPIGGTTGAGGGSPKFLMREDAKGRLHADGMLDDSKTKKAFLVKLPYTDSSNSIALQQTEKFYYDLFERLPLHLGEPMEEHRNILFISRFDRICRSGHVSYLGLESLYSAHNINIHGASLTHEANIELIAKFSSKIEHDVLEYFKRQILNDFASNTDNHGRNTSILKSEGSILLAPLYDVTAMKYFAADFIVPLTRWQTEHDTIAKQMHWIARTCNISPTKIRNSLSEFTEALSAIEHDFDRAPLPKNFLGDAKKQRFATLDALHHALESK